jgi:UDP-N-acetylmuramate: L-alanyl-gamma-D-glutamyl-meso-diaminopimelate ligase
MKLGTMKAALAGSLLEADLVFCYGANLGWDPAEALAELGDKAQSFTQLDDLINQICATAQSGDQILIMSNGGFGGIHDKLLSALA